MTWPSVVQECWDEHENKFHTLHNQECWDENTDKCHTKHNQECSEGFDNQCHTTYNQECWDEYSDQYHTEHRSATTSRSVSPSPRRHARRRVVCPVNLLTHLLPRFLHRPELLQPQVPHKICRQVPITSCEEIPHQKC